MAATVSVSKGVFAFKKKTKKETKTIPCNANYWWQESETSVDIQEHTYKNYQHCWNSANCIIEKLLHETHSKVLEDLVLFIKDAGSSKSISSISRCSRSKNDIPTACLVMGVNMPDHATIFDSLTKLLKQRVSPHVSRLSVTDCSSTKLAIFKIIHSIMNENGENPFFECDSEDEVLITSPQKKSLKRTCYNMVSLSSWYKETEVRCNQNSSPILSKGTKRTPVKKMKTSHQMSTEHESGRSLIVIFEEVEAVNVQVLQDIILVVSEYQANLPFLFIFGVSTTSSYIHRHLNQEASSALTMEVFQAQPSTALLSTLIEKLLMNSGLPFRLGGKVFKLLLDIFLFYDLSIKNFISGFKFCMMEHFMRGNASFLCCTWAEQKVHLRNLTPQASSALRNVPSYKKMHESLSLEEQRRFKDDSYLVKRVSQYLDNLDSWDITFSSLIKVLHCLVNTLPGSPLGKQLREVLSLCLGNIVTESVEFQSAWKLLSMSGKEEIAPRIEAAINILSENERSPALEVLLQSLKDYSKQMASVGMETIASNDEVTKRNPFIVELKPSDRFYLKERLLGLQKLKGSKNPFEQLRQEVLTCLEDAFITHLKPFQTLPFHEIIFFDSIALVKYHLLGPLRATITTGLANPHKYLQCQCCGMNDTSDLVPSLPDLSICYKLYLECGQLINLYDWMQAFVSLIGPHKNGVLTPPKKNKKKAIDKTLQARFVQAVVELQFLGFVKPTKRKTDHVQRLIWGGC